MKSYLFPLLFLLLLLLLVPVARSESTDHLALAEEYLEDCDPRSDVGARYCEAATAHFLAHRHVAPEEMKGVPVPGTAIALGSLGAGVVVYTLLVMMGRFG